MRTRRRGVPAPSGVPLSARMTISAPTGAGKSFGLPRALAALKADDRLRRAALEHSLLHAGPRMVPGNPDDPCRAIADRFGLSMDRLRECFGDRVDMDPGEIGEELSWFDPLPRQRSAMDLVALDMRRAVEAWRPG